MHQVFHFTTPGLFFHKPTALKIRLINFCNEFALSDGPTKKPIKMEILRVDSILSIFLPSVKPSRTSPKMGAANPNLVFEQGDILRNFDLTFSVASIPEQELHRRRRWHDLTERRISASVTYFVKYFASNCVYLSSAAKYDFLNYVLVPLRGKQARCPIWDFLHGQSSVL